MLLWSWAALAEGEQVCEMLYEGGCHLEWAVFITDCVT